MNLPTLYKKTSTGAINHWRIDVVSNILEKNSYALAGIIITTWGQVGGAEQKTEDVIKTGKNIGKSNETSAIQQAEAEATSQWEKKKKKGYVETIKDAKAGKVDDLIEGGVFPMLAKSYDKDGDKIKFPAYAQPKFDGHRCIAMVKDGEATLWTRTRKPITGLPHIIEALEKQYPDTTITLDGELYNHEYRNKFEELTSFIRNPEPKEGHGVVQYHIYDVVNEDVFEKRYRTHLEDPFKGHTLVGVETIRVDDEDELISAFDTFLAQGYEGAMVRNIDGAYVNKRSADLQKIKEFDDAEFKVVGVEEGRGKLVGHAIFVCITDGGSEFKAKMKGKTEDLKKFWENPKLAIGKQLTVKFQGITNKTGVPRFPVGMRFREKI